MWPPAATRAGSSVLACNAARLAAAGAFVSESRTVAKTSSKVSLLLRRRRAASLDLFAPSDEDIASRRSEVALPASQEYHIFKNNVAAATLVSRV